VRLDVAGLEIIVLGGVSSEVSRSQ
jgi:hypothetical protein